jgi:hypothetical protein
MNESPALDRLLDPTRCLEPTEFIDSDSASVEALAHRVQGDGTPIQKAVRLFKHVRDEIQYEFRAKLAKGRVPREPRPARTGRGSACRRPSCFVRCCALPGYRPRSCSAT